MRIRQVRPEFFTDPVTAHFAPDVRLTYIGLWCVADDAGYFTWNVSQISVLLYPYESRRVRERRVERAGEVLTEAGRITMFDCGCALIPKLADHQKIGGNKSFPAFDKHKVHTSPDKSARNVSEGRERNGGVRGGLENSLTTPELYALRDREDEELRAKRPLRPRAVG